MKIQWHILPNLITVTRLCLTAPIVWALLVNRELLALCLLGIAAITDWLDGMLARRYNYTSDWGAFLDPLADKALIIGMFGGYYYLSYLDWWVVVLAIGRDLLILLGVMLYRMLVGDLIYRPILSSKLNTALQLVLLLVVLISKIWSISMDGLFTVLCLGMVTTSIISFMQYAIIWVSNVMYYVRTR